ncbi:CgeB family protein [Sanguibacter antarcticus]|uniref:Spore maturation protein CgeB n=1 Tax=Sanguibacter antarcticus TaxID=372484 RepID=A0A2A9E251_9MICO|nr:glycosyltransferase [Sanguibacter antarcticus]PFG32269.1 spore maturation protein CgeB [Sanguibacter antarcticus]
MNLDKWKMRMASISGYAVKRKNHLSVFSGKASAAQVLIWVATASAVSVVLISVDIDPVIVITIAILFVANVALVARAERRRDLREGRIEATLRNVAENSIRNSREYRSLEKREPSILEGELSKAVAVAVTPPESHDRISPPALVVAKPQDSGTSALRPVNGVDWAVERQILPRVVTRTDVAGAYRASRGTKAEHVTVAIICDEFTHNSFAPEFATVPLSPDMWREQMEESRPEYLFCESAWAGVDPVARPWRGKIYGSVKFPYENRRTLFEILEYCKLQDIPTIFWNKEDPTHFSDRVNDFVDTASRFDYVYTTAEECIGEYQKFMGVGRVGLLPFAAQPRIFHPLPLAPRRDRVVFAGAWYRVHEERARVTREMFDAIIGSGRDLAIYDRDSGIDSPERGFPKEYQNFVHPAVSHAATAELYRGSTIGMNINTVTSSESMFARRVFELAASGSMVVSNYSPGIERYFGDSVIFLDQVPGALGELDEKTVAEKALQGLETVLESHTYRDRARTVLTTFGRKDLSRTQLPTLAFMVDSIQGAETACGMYRRRASEFHKLLLVVDASIPSHRVGEFYTAFNDSMCSVISARLASRQTVDPARLIETPDLLLVRSQIPSKAMVRRMVLHREYWLGPIVEGASHELAWGVSHPGKPSLISAADLLSLVLQPQFAVPALEVPSA